MLCYIIQLRCLDGEVLERAFWPSCRPPKKCIGSEGPEFDTDATVSEQKQKIEFNKKEPNLKNLS